jgi:tetratricopeptide (TPR) repeat protein
MFAARLQKPMVRVLLILVLVAIVYAGTLDFPFLWDDLYLVEGNPIVTDLGYFLDTSSAQSFEGYAGLRTRYLGYLSFALNYSIHGYDTRGYHLVNILIHALNSLLVMLIVMRLMRTPRLEGAITEPEAVYAGLFAGLLFAVHPVQSEAVTYIFQRLASLEALFALISIASYLRFRQSEVKLKKSIWYVVSLFFIICAMRTKENAFVLPLMLACIEFILFSGVFRQRVLILAPILSTMIIVPLGIVGLNVPVGDLIAGLGPSSRGFGSISRYEYLLTQFTVIIKYLQLIFIPVAQNVDYHYPLSRSLLEGRVLGAFLLHIVLIGSTAVAWFRYRQSYSPVRLVALGILWFYLALSVESGIIAIPMLIAEYRMYLPSVGIFIVITVGGIYLSRKLTGHAVQRVFLVSLVLLISVFAGLTISRNNVWKDGITFWTDVTEKSPLKPRGYNNLGAAYADKGELKNALGVYMKALELEPESTETLVNVGNVMSDMGNMRGAVAMYQRALEIEPGHPGIYFNFGVIYERAGNLKQAVWMYRRAIELAPEYVQPRQRLEYLRKRGIRE